jgi:hypothetical protein
MQKSRRIGTALTTIAMVFLLGGCSSESVATSVVPGACYNFRDDNVSIYPDSFVACSQPHDGEVLAVPSAEEVESRGGAQGFADWFYSQPWDFCDTQLQAYAGDASTLGYRATLALDIARLVPVCVAVADGDSQLTRGIADSSG